MFPKKIWWCLRIRKEASKQKKLSPAKIDKLDSIEDWVWDKNKVFCNLLIDIDL